MDSVRDKKQKKTKNKSLDRGLSVKKRKMATPLNER